MHDADQLANAKAIGACNKVSNVGKQQDAFVWGKSELIEYINADGQKLRAILTKPENFDPNKKYPLLCVIHGGPTGIDRPALPDRQYYPVDIWAAREAALPLPRHLVWSHCRNSFQTPRDL